MIKAEPWQTAEIAGPIRAFLINKPEVVVSAIRRSKRPIIVVGQEAIEPDLVDGKPVDYAIQIAEAIKEQFNYEIDRKKISIDGDSIKELGTYEAMINLYKDIKVKLNFEVVAE